MEVLGNVDSFCIAKRPHLYKALACRRGTRTLRNLLMYAYLTKLYFVRARFAVLVCVPFKDSSGIIGPGLTSLNKDTGTTLHTDSWGQKKKTLDSDLRMSTEPYPSWQAPCSSAATDFLQMTGIDVQANSTLYADRDTLRFLLVVCDLDFDKA